MKCAFVYFSSTGITPRYACEIAKGINEVEESKFEFMRVKKGKKVDLQSYDLIGIGAPAYSFRAPRLMTRILRKMDLHQKPFFVFATYNTMAGNTLWNLYHAVQKTAGICLGYIKVGVTVNIRAWKPKINSNKKLKEITNEQKEQAIEFGKILVKRYHTDLLKQTIEWIPKVKPHLVIWAAFLTWGWEMLCTVGIKRIDKKKCTSCGLCATKICPSNSIRLNKKNQPKFAEIYCVGCNGCVNLCPADAIWTYQTKNRMAYNLYKELILNDEDIDCLNID